jgi:hypothetical protein
VIPLSGIAKSILDITFKQKDENIFEEKNDRSYRSMSERGLDFKDKLHFFSS